MDYPLQHGRSRTLKHWQGNNISITRIRRKFGVWFADVNWPSLTLAVVIGTVGGAVFNSFGIPLAWMLGAMFATGIASASGLKIGLPRSIRDPWITILGVMLGSGFSSDMLAGLTNWLPSIAALPLYIVVLSFAGRIYLRRAANFEARTAFFSASPGGLAEMILLGDRYGGDMRTIALVHSTRVFLVVTSLPILISILIPEALGATPPEIVSPTLTELVVLLACAVIGYFVAKLCRFPAPQMFGPMLVSAIAHLLGLVEAAPPLFLVAAAQIVMGASLGSRFSGIPLHDILKVMTVGLGLTVILVSLSACIAAVISHIVDTPFIVLLIAFSPGGVAEMALVALALGADPTFVATIHILRIALVVASTPFLFRQFERRLI